MEKESYSIDDILSEVKKRREHENQQQANTEPQDKAEPEVQEKEEVKVTDYKAEPEVIEETSEKDQKDFRQEEAEGGYENGMLIIKLSNLSSIPPCPGIIFPESLIPAWRLNIDSTKSPSTPKRATIPATAIQ